MSIGKKLFRGAAWNATAQFGSQAINFFVLIILARLLGPEEFGLVGMVSVITSFLGYFSECGLTPALIQKKELDDLDCNTAFWSTAFFAVLIYGIVFLCAPQVEKFYNESNLTAVTRVLFVTFLFSPLAFIPESLERRRLSYDKIAIADLSSMFVSGAVGITLALMHFGIWSLVFQQISMTLVRGLTLIISTKWCPKIQFSSNRFKALIVPGGHFTARNLISYLSDNIDSLLVGKLLGPAMLGIYNLAFRISRYFLMKFYSIFGQMLFPAFASFRDDAERVRRNSVKVSLAGALLMIPLLISFYFGIEAIILYVVGPQWLGTIPIIRIFIFYLIFESVTFSDESILVVFGKLRMVNQVKIAMSVFLLLFGYIATANFGIVGMAYAFTAIAILNSLIMKGLALKNLNLSLKNYLINMRPVFITALYSFFILGFYSLATKGYHTSLLCLIGGIFLTLMIMVICVAQYKLVDFKNKKIDIDHLIVSI